MDWDDTKTNEPEACVEPRESPVEKFFENEGLHEKLFNAGVGAIADYTFACFRMLNPRSSLRSRFVTSVSGYDQRETLPLVRSRRETLHKSIGNSDIHALVCEGRGGRRGAGGRGKAVEDAAEAGLAKMAARKGARTMKSLVPRRLWIRWPVSWCRAKGHFGNDCASKICDR